MSFLANLHRRTNVTNIHLIHGWTFWWQAAECFANPKTVTSPPNSPTLEAAKTQYHFISHFSCKRVCSKLIWVIWVYPSGWSWFKFQVSLWVRRPPSAASWVRPAAVGRPCNVKPHKTGGAFQLPPLSPDNPYIYIYTYHFLSLSVINSGLEPTHTGTQSSSNLSTSRMRRFLLCKYLAVVYRNFNMQIPNITKLKRIIQVASRQLHPLLLGPRDPSGSYQVTCLTPRPNTHDVSRAVPHPLQLGHSAEVGASSRSFYVVFICFRWFHSLSTI